MEPILLDVILAQLRDALERDDLGTAVAILEKLRPADQADVFADLDDDLQRDLLHELDPGDSADILERLDDAEAAELAVDLPTETLVRIVDEMEPDEAADLLGDIPPEQAQAVLGELEEPEEIRPLLMHPDDSAGGLMTSAFLALRRRTTVADALNAIREWKPGQGDLFSILFVIDAGERLCGQVGLRDLLIAEPDQVIADIMDEDVISVHVGVDQEECARVMLREDVLVLPVVDDSMKLVGVVTLDDVADVIVEEATEDIQRFGGAQPLERSYLDSAVTFVTRKRISWLLLLFLTESLTGTVLRHFESELEQVVALTFFVPLLIGTGGNAGSQTSSTIIRALAVGDIGLGDALRTFWHEMRVGFLLGLGLAALAFVRTLTWGSEMSLAYSVALAIWAIVLWANMLGSLLPLLATRLRIDPTVVSGPVMSTLVDATGLFIYFTVAQLIMGL